MIILKPGVLIRAFYHFGATKTGFNLKFEHFYVRGKLFKYDAINSFLFLKPSHKYLKSKLYLSKQPKMRPCQKLNKSNKFISLLGFFQKHFSAIVHRIGLNPQPQPPLFSKINFKKGELYLQGHNPVGLTSTQYNLTCPKVNTNKLKTAILPITLYFIKTRGGGRLSMINRYFV